MPPAQPPCAKFAHAVSITTGLGANLHALRELTRAYNSSDNRYSKAAALLPWLFILVAHQRAHATPAERPQKNSTPKTRVRSGGRLHHLRSYSLAPWLHLYASWRAAWSSPRSRVLERYESQPWAETTCRRVFFLRLFGELVF